jgi:hypothetical protein
MWLDTGMLFHWVRIIGLGFFSIIWDLLCASLLVSVVYLQIIAADVGETRAV